jgi:2-polyprenyl-6-methoxyphenol hydroxylase-like FAD-dependent oxidoreductase
MEVFRSWGLADAMRAGGIDAEPSVAIGPTLVAEPVEVVSLSPAPLRELLAASPELPLMCPQDHLEPVLVREIRRLGGQVRFGLALTGLRVTHHGVRATLSSGAELHARFVVGADDPRSLVRAALGIDWQHLGTLGEFTQVLFRPDLAPLLGRRPHALAFVKHPAAEGVLLPVGTGRWSYGRRRGKAGDHPHWPALLRAATGLAGLRPRILAVQPFTMAAEVATRYRVGPGFLVGDAAHRMTPYGGLGLNTAVHDGHELGWRLGWVVRGLAGPALLDSYVAEREPVGRANAERTLREERDPEDGLPRDLGGTYRSPVIADDAPAPPTPGRSRTARPGERAPHAWLRVAGRRVSTLDLFANRLTVLAGGPGWRRAARDDAPLAVWVVGDDLSDPHGAVRHTYRLGPHSAVLVRPDGVVAWRHDTPLPGHGFTRLLSTAVDLALGRTRRMAAAG